MWRHPSLIKDRVVKVVVATAREYVHARHQWHAQLCEHKPNQIQAWTAKTGATLPLWTVAKNIWLRFQQIHRRQERPAVSKTRKLRTTNSWALSILFTSSWTHDTTRTNVIAAEQANPNKQTLQCVKQFLDYMHTNKNAVIRYFDMILNLNVHSDASFQTTSRARSRPGGTSSLEVYPRTTNQSSSMSQSTF